MIVLDQPVLSTVWYQPIDHLLSLEPCLNRRIWGWLDAYLKYCGWWTVFEWDDKKGSDRSSCSVRPSIRAVTHTLMTRSQRWSDWEQALQLCKAVVHSTGLKNVSKNKINVVTFLFNNNQWHVYAFFSSTFDANRNVFKRHLHLWDSIQCVCFWFFW